MAAQCIGFHFDNEGGPVTKPYDGKYLFDGENYQAVLDRFNNGLHVALGLIQSMKEYLELRRGEADRLTLYSKNAILRLNQLSILSRYGKTEEIQSYTYEMLEKQAQVIRASCDVIQSVITQYQQQVNEMYPKRRFSSRKYYRANEFKRLFTTARAPLKTVLDRLVKLRSEQRKAQKAINDDLTAFRVRDDSTTTNEEVRKLRRIERDIASEEQKQSEAQAAYIKRGTEILQQCQQLEKERLDQIGKTLLEFIQAIHPSHYSTDLLKNFKDLQSHVAEQQDFAKDVAQWAQHQGIRIPSET